MFDLQKDHIWKKNIYMIHGFLSGNWMDEFI